MISGVNLNSIIKSPSQVQPSEHNKTASPVSNNANEDPEVSKAQQRPDNETGARTHIEDEGGGAQAKRIAKVDQQVTSTRRQSSLGIEFNELAAQDRLNSIEFENPEDIFIDPSFHDEFLLALNDKILQSVDRKTGYMGKGSSESNTRTASDIVKNVAKVGLQVAVGAVLSPLAAFAIEAGFDVLGRLSKKLISQYYLTKAENIVDRLEAQFKTQSGHSLSAYRTRYAYTEMVMFNFYEKYSTSLIALNLENRSDKEKKEIANRFMAAIFSDSTISDAKKNEGKKLLVDSAESKIRDVFKEYGVVDSAYELSKQESLA